MQAEKADVITGVLGISPLLLQIVDAMQFDDGHIELKRPERGTVFITRCDQSGREIAGASLQIMEYGELSVEGTHCCVECLSIATPINSIVLSTPPLTDSLPAGFPYPHGR